MTTADEKDPCYLDEAGKPLAKCADCGHDLTVRGGVTVAVRGLNYDGRINQGDGRVDPAPVPGPGVVSCAGCKKVFEPRR